MLVAAIYALYLLFSGGGAVPELFTGLENRAADVIRDEARRARVVELSRSFEAVLDRTRGELAAGLDELGDLHRDYAAGRVDFAVHAERVGAALDERERAFLDTRAALKKGMSKQEWEAVVAQD